MAGKAAQPLSYPCISKHFGQFLFQYKCVPVHKIRSIKTRMSSFWCPDFKTWIEHLWIEVEQILRARSSFPMSLSDLTNELLEEWSKIPINGELLMVSEISLYSFKLNIFLLPSLYLELKNETNIEIDKITAHLIAAHSKIELIPIDQIAIYTVVIHRVVLGSFPPTLNGVYFFKFIHLDSNWIRYVALLFDRCPNTGSWHLLGLIHYY